MFLSRAGCAATSFISPSCPTPQLPNFPGKCQLFPGFLLVLLTSLSCFFLKFYCQLPEGIGEIFWTNPRVPCVHPAHSLEMRSLCKENTNHTSYWFSCKLWVVGLYFAYSFHLFHIDLISFLLPLYLLKSPKISWFISSEDLAHQFS